MTKTIDSRHPLWLDNIAAWGKYRDVYEGGDAFIAQYVEKFSAIETDPDYRRRLMLTPFAGFASSALDEIRTDLVSHVSTVNRIGGDPLYRSCVAGRGLGIDLEGRGMDELLAEVVIRELLLQGRVGVFVDKADDIGNSLSLQADAHPYLYTYIAEDILSWTEDPFNPGFYNRVLLRELRTMRDANGLPNGTQMIYRYVQRLTPTEIGVRFYNENGASIGRWEDDIVPADGMYIVNLPVVPFIPITLSTGLMKFVANHQIALTNLESADVAYALYANVPMYVEQSDIADLIAANRTGASSVTELEGTATGAAQADDKTVRTGKTTGRRYGKGLERPGFISPPSEPLEVSIKKQDRLKEDIRHMLRLSMSSVRSTAASGEALRMERSGTNNGLQAVGLTLEHFESRFAQLWSIYQGGEPATVRYPRDYSSVTDADRVDAATKLLELREKVPSVTFKRKCSLEAATILLGRSLTTDDIAEIGGEINKAVQCSTVVGDVVALVKEGVMPRDIAATLCNLPEGSAAQAKAEYVERLAAIAAYQSAGANGARGVNDLSADPGMEARNEKEASQNHDLSDDGEEKVRG